MLLNAQNPERWPEWLLALVLAWLVTGVVLLSAGTVSRFLGTRGLRAMERLMGMLLTTVAVEMFLKGIQEFFHIRPPGGPA
jgi:small neutral amino acid transporter SnatA (MarC family)